MWLTFGKLFCGVAALPKGLGVEVAPGKSTCDCKRHLVTANFSHHGVGGGGRVAKGCRKSHSTEADSSENWKEEQHQKRESLPPSLALLFS